MHSGSDMGLSMEDFGRLLKAKKGSRGVRAAALDADVSAATFSRVENGHLPDLETFAKLCKWLARDPREFLDMAATPISTIDTPKTVVHFKKKRTITIETAKALGELILVAQRALLAQEELVQK